MIIDLTSDDLYFKYIGKKLSVEDRFSQDAIRIDVILSWLRRIRRHNERIKDEKRNKIQGVGWRKYG